MKVSKTIPEKKETGRDAAIAELFCEYVKSMEDKPRHTTAAETEADTVSYTHLTLPTICSV